MSTATSKIAAKDAKNTGITPTIAKQLYDQLGATRIAIVELTSIERTVDLDDKKTVKLEIGFIEPCPDGDIENFLRELSQALYRDRQPQQPIDTLVDTEPTPGDILRRGKGLLLNGDLTNISFIDS